MSCARGGFQSEMNVVGVGDVSSLALLCFALLRQSRLADDGNDAPGDADQHSCMAVPGSAQVANGVMVGM